VALLVAIGSGCAPRAPAPTEARNPRSAARQRVFSPGSADPARRSKLVAVAPRLDEYYRAKLSESRATAATVGIVLDGELVYARGFGVREVESQAPVDADTVFRKGKVVFRLKCSEAPLDLEFQIDEKSRRVTAVGRARPSEVGVVCSE
jgi:hypothetical protein